MGAERLFERRVWVVLVRLVQVDVVGLQPLEGRLDRGADVGGREALLPTPDPLVAMMTLSRLRRALTQRPMMLSTRLPCGPAPRRI